jgi:hypothetical protein
VRTVAAEALANISAGIINSLGAVGDEQFGREPKT